MAINVAVEIFVIKTLSGLNLVIILVAQCWRRTPRHPSTARRQKAPRAACKNWRNPQLLAE